MPKEFITINPTYNFPVNPKKNNTEETNETNKAGNSDGCFLIFTK